MAIANNGGMSHASHRASAALALTLLLPAAGPAASAPAPALPPAPTAAASAPAAPDCAGFPGLAAPTAPGLCAALVLRAGHGLRMPRSVLWLGRSQGVDELLLVDMGSWEPRRGRLLLVRADARSGRAELSELLAGLDRPHGLVRGPDGAVWLGEASRIVRMAWPPTPAGAKPQPQAVLTGLPDEGRHPLKSMVFAPDGSLYFNVGAFTDRCEYEPRPRVVEGRPACAEMDRPQPQAAVWRARFEWPAGRLLDVGPYAIGLRNSMALAAHASGTVLQAENNIDVDDPRFPPEEINRLAQGAHYGWPACVGARQPMPGVPAEACAATTAPVLPLPAHSAPLHMAYAALGAARPGAAGLILSLHGYRPTGSRLVRYEINSEGVPQAPAKVLLGPWQFRDSLTVQRPGAPVGFAADDQGRLWIADDRNKQLLLLAPATAAR